MVEQLSAEDRSALIDAVYGPAGARPSDPDDACDAVIAACERIVAAAVVEERERIAAEIEAEPIPWALSDIGQRGWDMGRTDAARIARSKP